MTVANVLGLILPKGIPLPHHILSQIFDAAKLFWKGVPTKRILTLELSQSTEA